MSAAPKRHRAARLALPRLPLPALLGFAVTGFGGALFLAHTTFSPAETTYSLVPANAGPVYEARAVPRDSEPEEAAARAASMARAIVAQSPAEQPKRNEAEPEETDASSGPTLLSDTNRELKGFSRFANVGTVANSYLTLTGASFGMSAQMAAPNGFFAPAGETATFAPVPEPSTWLCSAALLALVVARGLHASWHRHQRRSASKHHLSQ